MRELGYIIMWVSMALLTFGYFWSMFIAWRVDKGLFLVVLLVWIVGYPALLVKYWQQSKKSLVVILAGLLSFALASALLAATNPNRLQSNSMNGAQHNHALQSAPANRSTASRFRVG